MNTAVSNVRAFMLVGDQTVRDTPLVPDGDATPTLILVASALKNLAAELKKHTDDERAFRLRLIVSEVEELAQALAERNAVETMDALVDIDYVTVGTALQFGLPHEDWWTTVHERNMAKFPICTTCAGGDPTCLTCKGRGRIVIRDAQGKILKPPGWTPPTPPEWMLTLK